MPFYNGIQFPKPLSYSEREELFLLFKQGNKEARERLIVDNMRLLIIAVKNKFKYLEDDIEDLISIGTIGLIKGIDTYNLSKGSNFKAFSTYLGRCISNEIKMFLRRKENKYYPRISIDEPVFIDEDCILTLGDTLDNTYNMIEDVNDRMRLNSIYESFSLLTDREKEIMRLYFGIGCNPKVQSEIAAIYGMERSNVSRIVSKSIYKIRRDLVTRKLLDENVIDSNKCKRISNN